MSIIKGIENVIVIGDCHGCYKTTVALIDQLPKDIHICFVGDIIDRGPDSRKLIEFVKNRPDTYMVMGNHERMMLNSKIDRHCCDIWMMNGGQPTANNYINNLEMFEEHLKWIESLPIYIEFKDCKDENGRYLVVSHSHISNVWRRLKNALESELDSLNEKIMWDRPFNLKQPTDIYNIIGHTPGENPKVKSFYANIDTGCVFTKKETMDGKTGAMYKSPYGKLTAIQFPSMKIWQQDNID